MPISSDLINPNHVIVLMTKRFFLCVGTSLSDHCSIVSLNSVKGDEEWPAVNSENQKPQIIVHVKYGLDRSRRNKL